MMPIAAENDTPPLLSDAEHAQMLADIADVALLLGTSLPPSFGASAGTENTPASPAERLQVLCQTLPAVAQCVGQIASSPPLALVRQTRTVAPPTRARRVSHAALLHAARAGIPLRSVEETVSATTADTPELRTVKSFLLALHRDAQSLQTLAARDGETEAADAACACAATLRGLLCLPLWNGVTAPMSPSPPTHRMLSSPALARLHHLSRAYFHALAVGADAPEHVLPPREAWRIYETWTLFQTARALLEIGFIVQRDALFPVRRDCFYATLQTSAASRLLLRHRDGRRVWLTYQPAYAAGERSRSRTMQPDIAIENEAGSVWIVDAKWKRYALPGDEGGDINQMHAYRDAILMRNGTPAARRAWCIFAGETEGRALVCYGLPESSVVGALRLRPSDAAGFDRFCTLLAAWLN